MIDANHNQILKIISFLKNKKYTLIKHICKNILSPLMVGVVGTLKPWRQGPV
jgi:hypothetical protein